MKDRIITFINAEKLSPARFADIIGVQPANISHILSGRNNPSLDFVQKMLKAFPDLNLDWLILGNGKMYNDDDLKEHSVFENKSNLFSNSVETTDKQPNNLMNMNHRPENIDVDSENIVHKTEISKESETKQNNREIERIIICYSDKTFEFYYPR